MAYVDAFGNMLRVTIATQMVDAQTEENNFGFVCTSNSGGGDTRAALGAFVLAAFNSAILPTIKADAGTYGFKVSQVGPKPPPLPVTAVSASSGTAASGVTLPTQSRPVISWQTLSAGKGYRGRNYLPTPTSLFITTGLIPTSGYLTQANALVASLLGGLTSGGTTWALALLHKPKPPTTLVWTASLITAGKARAAFGTQRRSGNYGRPNYNPPW